MSKDKLNDLKKWKMNLNETLVLNGHEISEELKEETRKYRDLLGYAIEQAELVRELEKENEKLRKLEKYDSLEINNLSQQNNRYREALEFYALGRHWITSLKDGRDYVNEYGERARKALECEE